jgi:uncharacterized protein
MFRPARPLLELIACAAAALAVGPCALGADTKAREGLQPRQDLEIVDCLLPGQVRQLGTMTYLTQRRPTRTTASDCRIRGGEYVAYDRSDYKSALRVWMDAATAGDADAMTNVGEIYERGLGSSPNYEAAVIWYQKAADKGNARAKFDLGTLYEQGLGVEKDPLKALNLYRDAWGVPADNLIYESAARKETDALRAQLEQNVADKDRQISALKRQVEQADAELQKQRAAAPVAATATSAEVESLRRLVEQLEADRMASKQKLASLAQTRAPSPGLPAPPIDSQAAARIVKGMDFGRFFALIIGNQHYNALEDLQTPRADAERVARVLKDKYGFTVQVLEDVDDVAVLRALNDLNRVLKPSDNLLIYYAGHGYRLPSNAGVSGFWLPINADPPPVDTFWIPNEQITGHLGRIAALRVLVVADSCYAGLLSTEPSFLFLDSNAAFSIDYVKLKLPKRARLLLSSGGDEPVLDAGGGHNSVFANAFLEILESNTELLPSPALYAKVVQRVKSSAAHENFKQVPEFKAIKGAGHEVGDFFFVPVALTRS